MQKNLIFIAEVGMNHNGNFDLCFELIKQAKLAGADIVKFQLGWRNKPGEINNIDKKIISKLINWSNYFNIEIMFSIITDEAYKLVKTFKMKRYKIASRTVKYNPLLIKKILKEKKILSYLWACGVKKNYHSKKVKIYLTCGVCQNTQQNQKI